METFFSLFSDPWIPVMESPISVDSLISLETLWKRRYQIYSLSGSPFFYSAVLRLLAALSVYSGKFQEFEWNLTQNIFCAAFSCPDSSSKNPLDFLNFVDGNSVAWSPRVLNKIPEYQIAQSLVQSYFSDRPGLKARVPGFSVSGSAPPHIGKTSILKAGNSVGELLDLNIDSTWGMSGFEFFIYPWRQIKITENNRMIVASNVPYSGGFGDPWVRDSGRMKYIRQPPIELLGEEDTGDFISLTFVMKQAKLLACDCTRFTKEKG